MKQVLFYTRLLLYLLALAIPLIHPAVVVPFDRVGLIFWFFLIPLEMLTAFYLSSRSPKVWVPFAAGPILVFTVFFSGWNPASLLFIVVAFFAFALTFLVFKTTLPGLNIALLEPFPLAFL